MGKRQPESSVPSSDAANNKKTKILPAFEEETTVMNGKILKVMMEFHVDERFDIKL